MGSARVALEAREREEERRRREEADRKKRLFEQKRCEKEARVSSIEAEFITEADGSQEISRGWKKAGEGPSTRRAACSGEYAKPIRTVRAGTGKKPASQGGDDEYRFVEAPEESGDAGEGLREEAGRPAVRASSLRGRPDEQVSGGLREPEKDLRGALGGPVPDRGDRPAEEPAARPGRPDPGHSDAGEEVARSRSRRSSGTSPTRSASSWAWMYAPPMDRRGDPWLKKARHPAPGRAARRRKRMQRNRFEKAVSRAGQGSIPASPLRCGHDPPVGTGHREPQRDLRGAPCRPLRPRGDRHLPAARPLAKGEQIIAAPTLVKKLPPPLRQFIGDMSDRKKILIGLDIRKKEGA